jgi:hypothetical protein
MESVIKKNGVEEQVMKWVVFQKEFDGVPICLQYKYLGTYLDFKLSMEIQIKHIKRKCRWIFIRLYPYLAQASAERRRDIWQIMIAPLLESLPALINEEYSVSAIEKVFRLWRGTFKQIMMLPKKR